MSDARHAKVVVIDDELGPRESVRLTLKNDFDVFCATSVDDGLLLVREHRPDVIIMDIRMPGKNGIEGLQAIRAIDPHVAVVMLTGYSAIETAQQALRHGASDYVSKPFDTREMLQTVRKHAERTGLQRRRVEMLRELRDINARLVHDLAVKEQMATLGESSAEMIHDLRNPLTIVSGYVDLLASEIERTKAMNGQATEYLAVIEQNVRRCVELAHMWQKFGKSASLRFKRTELGEVMEDIRRGAEPYAATAGVALDFPTEAPQVGVNGIGAQLVRAVHNIVANAVEACAPGRGLIQVRCHKTDVEAVITVQDNGSGMSPEVLSRMFEPYFTTKSEGRGTGLGMIIARKIVEEHHGTLTVESKHGEGTTVTIRLPLLKPAEATATAA